MVDSKTSTRNDTHLDETLEEIIKRLVDLSKEISASKVEVQAKLKALTDNQQQVRVAMTAMTQFQQQLRTQQLENSTKLDQMMAHFFPGYRNTNSNKRRRAAGSEKMRNNVDAGGLLGAAETEKIMHTVNAAWMKILPNNVNFGDLLGGILGQFRNAAQRKIFKESYKQHNNVDLIQLLQENLSGEFKNAVCQWMLDPSYREAGLAYNAVNKGDYRVIIELSCISSAEELLALKSAYKARYKHSLEEDIASHFSDDMRKLLLLLVSVHRYESEVTEAKLAEAEAEILHKCIQDKAYKHDEIIRILTTRSKAQLVATFYRFRDVYGTPITKSITSDQDQAFVSALHAVIRCTKSPQKYLERVLSEAIVKRGTDVDGLTRVIVTRADKDLGVIKELFYKRNGVTLEHAIAKETHGEYKGFLVNLLEKMDR